jgi:hypothetical protein
MEGGASGHMAHPYDYTEFTLRDLKGLIRHLFEGKVEDVTEKIDGTNIQATVNKSGEVVFIRNKGNLNSEKGGMTISDMAAKWSDNAKVANTFLKAGETITKVFSTIPNKFFNPDDETRVIVNCECVVAGQTNIMPYAKDMVDFHDLWIYKFNGSEWEQEEVTKKGLDIINKACEKIDGAQLTPQVIIKKTEDSQKILVNYIKQLDKIFKEAKCNEQSTLGEWQYSRFVSYCKENADWILTSKEGTNLLFKRWFYDDKSTNIKKVCEFYPEYSNEVRSVDKSEFKKWVRDIMKPIDDFFIDLGGAILDLCDGLLNNGIEDQVINTLINDVEYLTKEIENGNNEDLKSKLMYQLSRLSKSNIRSTEGIVFRYKDKLMKLTSSFAPLNQILGSIKFSK